MLVGGVGGTAAQFHLGQHRLGKGRVGLAHGDGTVNVLVHGFTVDLDQGQPSEGDVTGDEAVAHVAGYGIVRAACHLGKGHLIAVGYRLTLNGEVGDVVAEADRSDVVLTEV